MTQPIIPLSMLAGVNRFDSDHDGWSLLGAPTHEGARIFVGHVRFDQAFTSPPVVHLGLVGFDIAEHDSSRLRVRAVDITSEGFFVRAETWFNTQVYSIDVS